MKRFLIIWVGELLSTIGSGLSAFGLGVYVYQQTGMATATALVSLLALLPTVLLGPLAGVLADRYDRRKLMILGDGLSALGLLYILLCMMRGRADLANICVGVTVSSIFASLLEPAYRATITDLIPKAQHAKASGLAQMAGSAKFLISPFLAGLLIKHSGIELILWIDVGTLLITASGFLFFMCLPFANTCLDILVRQNIPNEAQGRAWGMIGLISQLGYVAANAIVGYLADYVFAPALREGGVFYGNIGRLIGTGAGRGAALLIIFGGICMCVLAPCIYRSRSIRSLEKARGSVQTETR